MLGRGGGYSQPIHYHMEKLGAQPSNFKDLRDSIHSLVTIYFESYKNTLGKQIGEQRVQHRV